MMNTRQPLFSIVTVCLNPGKDLPRTVESVLSQDFADFEYIIKDGVSQDGTEGFECSDPRVTFVSQPDGGIYDAMNQALALCRGRYINFMNTGDTLRISDALSAVARLLKTTAYPDIAYVDRYNEKLDIVTHYPASLTPWYLFRRPVCHQALFVKRSLLLRLGGFDTRYRILADYDVLIKLALVEKASHVHCPLVAVTYKDDGVSSDPRNRRQKLDEVKRLRRAHFSLLQRCIYGALWQATLPAVRIRLIQQRQIPWLRRALAR